MRHARVRPAAIGILTGFVLCACSNSPDEPRLVGTLERDRIEIVAEASEPIVEILVREGERVEAGQRLLRQETDVSAARIAQARAQVIEARQRLTELERGERPEVIREARARVASARAVLVRDERELERVQELIEAKLVAQSQLDMARAARDTSRAALREAEAQLAVLLNGTREEQIAQARAAVEAAEYAERQLALSSARLEVHATRSGVIEALPYEVGERPPAGAPIVIMLADTAAYARVYVPEPRRVKVQPGTPARVYVDGLDEPLEGRVRFVASSASFTPYFALTQRDRSRLTFLAEVEITGEQAASLPAGVPVEVELIDGAAPGTGQVVDQGNRG